MCCCTTAFGEVNGKKGAWGHAIGGMGAITQAMAKRGRRARRRDRHRTRRSREVLVEQRPRRRRRARGRPRIARARGRRQRQSQAALRAAGAARRAAGGLPRARMRRWQGRLRHVPHERRAVGAAELHRPARQRRRPPHRRASSSRRASPTWTAPITTRGARLVSQAPIVEMLIPSTLDDSLAPPGAACRQPVLPARRAGTARRPHWDDRRDEVADLMIDTVDAYAPGFRAERRRPPGADARSISSAIFGLPAATSSTAR